MIENSYNNLMLNSHFYTKNELIFFIENELEKTTIDTHNKSLYLFIKEWLNDEEFIEVKTSGSTGKPKIIQIRKKQMVASAKATGTFFKLNKNDKALLCLPCNYIAGKMMVVRAFVLGLNLVTANPSSIDLSSIGEVNFAAMIPYQVKQLLAQKQDLTLIKRLIIGGAAIDNDLYYQLQLIPNFSYATYGMTETVTHVAVKLLNGMAKDSFYKALPNVVFSQDERDCLVIDAPLVASERVVTNDIVRLYDNNQFAWIGRYDNVINSGGIKFSPEEIESKIAKVLHLPFFICGLADEKLGEKMVLIIEKENNINIKKEDIFNKLNEELEKYEIPKKIYFIPQFIYTETGKIKRKESIKNSAILGLK